MRNLTATKALGLGSIALAILVIFVWIPLDTETWLVERKRGSYILGDSLAPTLAAVFVLVAGGLLLFDGRESEKPSRDNLRFIGAMIGIGVISLTVMRWAGPALATLLAEGGDYRLLRDTVPWKYIGFVLGGVALIFSMIAFVEERLSWRAFLIALAAVAGIILLYDVPFDDILLPPNGDV